MRFEDLNGKKFNRLTVIKRTSGTIKKHTYWECKCDCGNTTIVASQKLKNGSTKSCGCYGKEKVTRHGMWNTRVYKIWCNMKSRCNNSKLDVYEYYGARGITVCEEWENDFMSFYKWAMDNGYDEKLTLDRIDVDKNYEPNNCRWVTMKTQANNTRRNHIIEYKGAKHTISEWADLVGINKKILAHRLERGWEIERALTQKVINRNVKSVKV